MFYQKHTQMPGKGRTNDNVVGAPMYPYFMAKTGAFFFFIFGALALAATFAQINPIWLYGPYNPVGDLGRLAARLLHGLPRGLAAHDARLAVGGLRATRSPSTCSSRPWCRSG